MDLGHVARRIARRDHTLGNAEVGRNTRTARLVRLRIALGLHAHDQSVTRVALAVSGRVGSVSSLVEARTARWLARMGHTPRDCDWNRNFVLCPLDDPQLLRLPPLRPAPVNFPLELYIGNNENYDDQHPHYPGMVTKDRETWRYLRMGETPFMDEEMRKAKKFIFAHPRVEMILLYERFVAFWGGIPNPIDKFLATDSWLVRTLILCAALSGIGTLLGIITVLSRRSPYTYPLAVFPAIFPFLYYLTHTSLRYRHPIDPILLLLNAIAIGAFVQIVFRRRAVARHPTATTNRSA